MVRLAYILLFCVVWFACSCSGNHANHKPSDADASELAFPDVPAELTNEGERSIYIVRHFWDALDWRDTLRIHRKDFVAANVSKYVSALAFVPTEEREMSLKALLKATAPDTTAFRLFTAQLENDLGDPNSPLRNEDSYICFLRQFLRMPGLPEEVRTRSAFRLKMALKNHPGTIATDFSFTTREGKRMKLSQFEAKNLVLVFYDPECPHCGDILDMLRENPRLQQALAEGKAKVLAVYTEGNREVWNKSKYGMPDEWTIAIDESKIVDKALYDISAMPMVYLLDQNKRVVIKDAKIE